MRPASTHEDPAKGLELREAYWATHADPDLTASRVGLPDTRGAHLGYLDLLLRKSSTGWVAGGEGPTIAGAAEAGGDGGAPTRNGVGLPGPSGCQAPGL